MEEVRPRGKPAREISDLEHDAIFTARKQGWSIRRIAAYLGIPKSTVYDVVCGPSLRRLDDLELVFPTNGFTPTSEPTPIKPGDPAICMVSHQSGLDFLPRLQADHRGPAPESTIYRPGEYKGGKG